MDINDEIEDAPAPSPDREDPPESRPEQAVARWAAAATVGRVLQSALALVSVSVLLAVLGKERFSAWAVLLGGSTLLVAFDAGTGPTLVRFLTPAMRRGDVAAVSRTLSSGFFPLFTMYLLVIVGVSLGAAPLAAWLEIPSTPLFSPAALVRVCIVGFAAQALLVLLLAPAQAAERWVMVAVILTVSAVLANVAAWVAGWTTERLDLVAISYWTGYAAGLAGGSIVARSRVMPWSLSPMRMSGATFRELVGHGSKLQVSQVCSLVNFQLGKLMLPSHAGLVSVAPLEAAERGHAGLRGFPIAALNVLLPEISARSANGEETWKLYERMTRAAALACIVCLALPVALSPLLFRAWVGDTATTAIPLFAVLLPGIALNLFAAPVSIMVQGLGRPGIQATAAAASLVLNVVFLFLLLEPLGAMGAALASSGAMTLSSIAYMVGFHRIQKRPLGRTLMESLRLAGPALPVPIVAWFVSDALATELGEGRVVHGVCGVALAGVFVFIAAWIVKRSGRMSEMESRAAASLPVIGRWFA